MVALLKRRKKCTEAWKKEAVMIKIRELQMNKYSTEKNRTGKNIFRVARKNNII